MDFSFGWLDESTSCWISFSSCAFGCCNAVTVHEYFPVHDVANGYHIHVSVRNNHGFYSGVVAAISMHEAEAIEHKKLNGAEKAIFMWELQEAIISAKQSLIIFEREKGAD